MVHALAHLVQLAQERLLLLGEVFAELVKVGGDLFALLILGEEHAEVLTVFLEHGGEAREVHSLAAAHHVADEGGGDVHAVEDIADVVQHASRDLGHASGARGGDEFLALEIQLLLRALERRDVARDADDAGDLAHAVVNGNLRHRGPNRLAGGTNLLLHLRDDGLARGHDVLLVMHELPRQLRRVEVKIRLPDDLLRRGHAHALDQRFADLDEARLGVLEVDAVRDAIEQRLQQVAGVLQFLLRALEGSDVLADAEGADDVARRVAPRELRGEHPRGAAVGEGLFLDLAEHRLPGAEDLLLVRKRLHPVLLAEQIQVTPAHQLVRVVVAHALRQRDAGADETRLEVLEIHRVRHAFEEHVHQRALELNLLLEAGLRGRLRGEAVAVQRSSRGLGLPQFALQLRLRGECADQRQSLIRRKGLAQQHNPVRGPEARLKGAGNGGPIRQRAQHQLQVPLLVGQLNGDFHRRQRRPGRQCEECDDVRLVRRALHPCDGQSFGQPCGSDGKVRPTRRPGDSGAQDLVQGPGVIHRQNTRLCAVAHLAESFARAWRCAPTTRA